MPVTRVMLSEASKDLWTYMPSIYHAHVVDKDSALEMQVVGWFLQTIGVLDKDKFLKEFATTIGTSIYIPFTVGEGDENELWHQIRTCVHEHQHIEQLNSMGYVRFVSQYANSDGRAKLEAEAYRTNMEIEWWRFHRLLNVQATAARLTNYALGPSQISFVEKYLVAAQGIVKSGGVVSAASKKAIQRLNMKFPALKYGAA